MDLQLTYLLQNSLSGNSKTLVRGYLPRNGFWGG
jgi:hypothetical protein